MMHTRSLLAFLPAVIGLAMATLLTAGAAQAASCVWNGHENEPTTPPHATTTNPGAVIADFTLHNGQSYSIHGRDIAAIQDMGTTIRLHVRGGPSVTRYTSGGQTVNLPFIDIVCDGANGSTLHNTMLTFLARVQRNAGLFRYSN